MNNAQIGDKILSYDNQQTTDINTNKNKIEAVEQSVTALDTKLSKDYIVDSGSNTRGNWEKWESGKLIQWGTQSFDEGVTFTSGALFASPALEINLPYRMIELPQITQLQFTRTDRYGFASVQYSNAYKIGFRVLTNSSLSVGNSFPIHFYVIGRWK